MSNQALTREAGIDREQLLNQVGDRASTMETLQNAWVIARRELQDSFRDWRIIAPIFIFTLVFPFLANIGTGLFIGLFEESTDTDRIFKAFIPLMPMIVGFFPISISLVVALDSFVGEKERRSLEPLLATPLTNLELYIGKVVASTLPPLAASYVGMTVYLTSLVISTGRWDIDPIVLLQIVVLTTVQAVVMVTGAVIISSQTTSTRASNLLASLVLIPMSLVTIVEAGLIINYRFRAALWYMALAMVIVTILLVRIGVRLFNREEMLGRSIDNLNLGWILRTVKDQFVGLNGEKFTVRKWYRRSVLPALPRYRVQLRVILLAMLIAYVAGFAFVYLVEISQANVDAVVNSETFEQDWPDFWEKFVQTDPLVSVITSLRVTLFMLIVGSVTFGVMGIVGTTVPMLALGMITGFALREDVDLIPMLAAMLPQGLFDLIALVMGGAIALRAGSIIAATLEDETIGEVWLRAIGDGLKLMVGIILPVAIIGGLVEAIITPLVFAALT
ncbi:MAG: ABC transporter permease subunit [Chloroflexi bacterium]|nr:ABC transporter permease subunit [Chloroflexota bacterium]